jgi:hypothetical protein
VAHLFEQQFSCLQQRWAIGDGKYSSHS